MPRRIVFLLMAMVVFLGLILMVTLQKQPPEIPADRVHEPARGQPDECLECHGPEGKHPRGPNHPMGAQPCGNCHFWQGEVR